MGPTQQEAPGSPATQDMACAPPGSSGEGDELSWPPEGALPSTDSKRVPQGSLHHRH